MEVRAKMQARLDTIAMKLDEAVAAGDLTAEEARAKLVEVKAGLAHKMKLRALEHEIRAAVEAGLPTARNRIFLDRMEDVGAISAEDAISYGITGPVLRRVC